MCHDRVEEMYGKMARYASGSGHEGGHDAAGGGSEGDDAHPPALPLKPVKPAEQIYAMGEQYLVEGLY